MTPNRIVSALAILVLAGTLAGVSATAQNPRPQGSREESRERSENRSEPQPAMREALEHLQQAEHNLQNASHDKGGHRAKAIQLIQQAKREVEAGIQYDNTHDAKH
jgi:hypothetical protein